MDPKEVRAFYEKEGVVLHYGAAVNRVGLWNSEEILFSRIFNIDQHIIELGCGAGRIAFGLLELGYKKITPMDYSCEMIQVARNIAAEKSVTELDFQVGDATQMEYEDESFEGAIFGFNGLMQIPGWNRRMDAMEEIYRVLKPSSFFYFTTHDRDSRAARRHWKKDAKLWQKGMQHPDYDDQGDTIGGTDWGDMFIHVPTRIEIEGMLEEVGFQLMSCDKRSDLAVESLETRKFSDDCLLWVVKKPATSTV